LQLPKMLAYSRGIIMQSAIATSGEMKIRAIERRQEMGAQLVAPDFVKQIKRAKDLNDREKKDVYHHPTERGTVKRSIDLASPNPMSGADSGPKSSAKERWIEAYLIQEARRNSWMLGFGEKQYKVEYSQGDGKRSRLHYVPCGARNYRALFPENAKRSGTGLRYVKCGKGQYKAQYAQNGDRQNSLNYLECEGKQYKAEYPQDGEKSNGLHYFKCGQKQYRLLCSELDFGKRRSRANNGHGSLDLLMYDEDTRNLVVLELKSKRDLARAKEELDAYCEAIRERKDEIKKAFDLDGIGGLAGYVVAPANVKRSNGTEPSIDLGSYGLIEYPEISKPWEEFSKARQQGKNLKLKFTCRKLAKPRSLG